MKHQKNRNDWRSLVGPRCVTALQRALISLLVDNKEEAEKNITTALKLLGTPTKEDYVDGLTLHDPDSGCWIWCGTMEVEKHPVAWYEGTSFFVTRFNYARTKKIILHPSTHRIELRCKNERCVNPAHMKMTHHGWAVPIEIRIDELTSPEPNTGCWLWMGELNDQGYPILSIKEDTKWVPRLVHRLNYVRFKGPLTQEAPIVRHKCDFPLCINPEHLLSGTQADNIADMISRYRGHWQRGSN